MNRTEFLKASSSGLVVATLLPIPALPALGKDAPEQIINQYWHKTLQPNFSHIAVPDDWKEHVIIQFRGWTWSEVRYGEVFYAHNYMCDQSTCLRIQVWSGGISPRGSIMTMKTTHERDYERGPTRLAFDTGIYKEHD